MIASGYSWRHRHRALLRVVLAGLLASGAGCTEHIAIGQLPEEAPPDVSAPPMHGLRAEFFKSLDQTGTPVAVRIDPFLNFYWEQGMPVVDLDEVFSARWTGDLEVPFDDTYTVVAEGDDSCSLFLDGRLVISNAAEGGISTTIRLTQGRHSIRADLSSEAGNAAIQVSWSSPRLPKEILATARLYPPSN